MAYILNGYNQKERDEVVSMHTRVHEDNLKSLEKLLVMSNYGRIMLRKSNFK